ncbi:MAG: transposase [Gammaproteobacteria bacterium]
MPSSPRSSPNPEKLADLARGTARKKRSELVEALHGRIRDHHRGLLKVHLELVAALEQALADIDAAVGKTLAPIHTSARLLTTLPGVSDLTAQVMVAEIGVDMARFPTPAHLISWTGLCPRSDESAGKRRSTRVRQGAPWLKSALLTAAWAAVRLSRRDRSTAILRLVRRLNNLGCQVQLTPQAA